MYSSYLNFLNCHSIYSFLNFPAQKPIMFHMVFILLFFIFEALTFSTTELYSQP
jgi:hypothetical protein